MDQAEEPVGDGAISPTAEERLRAMVQLAFDAVLIADEQFDLVFVSQAFVDLFGFDADYWVGRNGFDFLHPDEREELSKVGAVLLDTAGELVETPLRFRCADGTYRWVECRVKNMMDVPSVRGLVVSMRDVHESRLALEELSAVEREVRESEARLRALMRNADGITVVIDTQGEVQWSSPNAGRLWGLTEQELRSGNQVDRIHPDDRSNLVRQVTKVIEVPSASSRVEVRMRHADGTWRWYEVVYTNCLDDPAVGGIVANTRDVTERALAEQALRLTEERLEYQATHDELTDLPNRTLLFDRVRMAFSRARQNGTQLAALVLDLDHFKVVNDSQGHARGDELLVRVAERLQERLRPSDTVARLGGDEFLVLCEDLTSADEAVDLAGKLMGLFDEPFVVEGSETYIEVSIGVAASDADASNEEALVRDADVAMNQAKVRGRNRYEVFDAQLRARAIERHELRSGLRQAIERDEWEVHFQPIVDLRTLGSIGSIGSPGSPFDAQGLAGVEALVRWRHPTRGLLGPDAFISAAEESGLIIALGAKVLAGACELWSNGFQPLAGPATSFVSVNVSARQLASTSLLADVAGVLEGVQLEPSRLHLEITESALMVDPDESIAVLEALKALGVNLSVDDFGTGYSSFAYLRRLPVDALKIDKSFIDGVATDERDQALVGGMVQLAHTLGLTVVAEGVETPGQRVQLSALGCDLAQGYHFARPMPPSELQLLLGA
jgi:diguanylate cyclase (GGDEF)-like protein/PAS domain S-box-containing protein